MEGAPAPRPHLAGIDAALDPAGFVAAAACRGCPWTVSEYMDLCEAGPWTWFASQDRCGEPEVAGDEDAVLDRISGTVRLNTECHNQAARRGIGAASRTGSCR